MTINYKGEKIPVYAYAHPSCYTLIERIGAYKIGRIRGTDILIALPIE